MDSEKNLKTSSASSSSSSGNTPDDTDDSGDDSCDGVTANTATTTPADSRTIATEFVDLTNDDTEDSTGTLDDTTMSSSSSSTTSPVTPGLLSSSPPETTNNCGTTIAATAATTSTTSNTLNDARQRRRSQRSVSFDLNSPTTPGGHQQRPYRFVPSPDETNNTLITPSTVRTATQPPPKDSCLNKFHGSNARATQLVGSVSVQTRAQVIADSTKHDPPTPINPNTLSGASSTTRDAVLMEPEQDKMPMDVDAVDASHPASSSSSSSGSGSGSGSSHLTTSGNDDDDDDDDSPPPAATATTYTAANSAIPSSSSSPTTYTSTASTATSSVPTTEGEDFIGEVDQMQAILVCHPLFQQAPSWIEALSHLNIPDSDPHSQYEEFMGQFTMFFETSNCFRNNSVLLDLIENIISVVIPNTFHLVTGAIPTNRRSLALITLQEVTEKLCLEPADNETTAIYELFSDIPEPLSGQMTRSMGPLNALNAHIARQLAFLVAVHTLLTVISVQTTQAYEHHSRLDEVNGSKSTSTRMWHERMTAMARYMIAERNIWQHSDWHDMATAVGFQHTLEQLSIKRRNRERLHTRATTATGTNSTESSSSSSSSSATLPRTSTAMVVDTPNRNAHSDMTAATQQQQPLSSPPIGPPPSSSSSSSAPPALVVVSVNNNKNSNEQTHDKEPMRPPHRQRSPQSQPPSASSSTPPSSSGLGSNRHNQPASHTLGKRTASQSPSQSPARNRQRRRTHSDNYYEEDDTTREQQHQMNRRPQNDDIVTQRRTTPPVTFPAASTTALGNNRHVHPADNSPTFHTGSIVTPRTRHTSPSTPPPFRQTSLQVDLNNGQRRMQQQQQQQRNISPRARHYDHSSSSMPTSASVTTTAAVATTTSRPPRVSSGRQQMNGNGPQSSLSSAAAPSSRRHHYTVNQPQTLGRQQRSYSQPPSWPQSLASTHHSTMANPYSNSTYSGPVVEDMFEQATTTVVVENEYAPQPHFGNQQTLDP